MSAILICANLTLKFECAFRHFEYGCQRASFKLNPKFKVRHFTIWLPARYLSLC